MSEGVERRLTFDSGHEVLPEFNGNYLCSASEALTIEVAAQLEGIASDDLFEIASKRLQQLHGDHHLIWCARVRRLIHLKRFQEAQELIRSRVIDEYDEELRI